VVGIGQVLLGKYRVESILGRGAMGVVTECMHIALNERVAIKLLRQDVMSDRGAVERFLREAQAAVKLKSEYVARVSDTGTFENGTPYMVMEYLDGQDLGARIKQQGRLPIASAIELMLQAAEALSEAHALGIVHRDVKPTNLFVTLRPDRTELIKVLDFGISKAPMGDDLHLTNTQALLGTPAYMSPEQMRSARLVDGRTDIWSLGTVMYELIEGRRPFEAESFSEMCVTVSVDDPRPMTVAPPELQRVILRCLAKNPEQRYSSMADLGRDLLPFVRDQHQGVILVERMQRMLRHQGSDGGVPAPVRDAASQKVPSARPATPVATPATASVTASTVDTARGERDTSDTDRGVGAPPAPVRWLAQAPATVPEVPRFDQNDATDEVKVTSPKPDTAAVVLVAPPPARSPTPTPATPTRSRTPTGTRTPEPTPASARSAASKPVQAVSTSQAPARPTPTPPPARAPTPAAPPSGSESVVGGDDTFFEVASAHVPPSDRRGDDLVPAPRAPRVPVPTGIPMPPLHVPGRSDRRRMVLILLVAVLVSGAGALGIALGSRGHKSRVARPESDGSATSVIFDASVQNVTSGSDTGSGAGSDPQR